MSTTFEATIRPNPGQKGEIRALRLDGQVPGVLYGAGKDPVSFALSMKVLRKAISEKGFLSGLHTLEIDKKKEQVLVRDVQFHPVKDIPIHLDFMRVGKGTLVHVAIPLNFTNEDKAPGIKRGGILNTVVHAIDVMVKAQEIPEQIEFSLEGRDIGESVHLSDLTLPKGVEVMHLKDNQTLATIVAPSGLTSEEATSGTEESETEEDASDA